MISTKPIKQLSEIVLPFRFTPTKTLEGNVNGKGFYFPANKSAIVNFSEYEILINAGFIDELKN